MLKRRKIRTGCGGWTALKASNHSLRKERHKRKEAERRDSPTHARARTRQAGGHLLFERVELEPETGDGGGVSVFELGVHFQQVRIHLVQAGVILPKAGFHQGLEGGSGQVR